LKLLRLRRSIGKIIQRLWLTRGSSARLLYPISVLVIAILWLRKFYFEKLRAAKFHTSLPVLVIGNIYAGGTGKTPATVAITNGLKSCGWRPGVISRGYGVRLGSTPRVGSGDLRAHEFGDEPALIAQKTNVPISVHPNREAAASALVSRYPDVNLLICDDGLQHLALRRDIEIVVQDARKIGNGWVQPAGPLREPASRLNLCDVVITNVRTNNFEIDPQFVDGNSNPRHVFMYQQISKLKHLGSQTELSLEQFLEVSVNKTVSAIAAIGEPEQFFQSLRSAGIDIAATIALPDHETLTKSLLSQTTGELILITAKDAIKCNDRLDERLWLVETNSNFSDNTFITWLHEKLRLIHNRKLGLRLQ